MTNSSPIFFSWVPGIIRDDFIRKFIALFFAVLLVWKVSRQLEVEESVENVRLDVVTYGNVVLLDKDIAPLRVTVKSRLQEKLRELSPSDFKFVLDINELQFKQNKPIVLRILDSVKISKPLGIEIVNIRPDTVTLHLDKKISRELPVKVRFTGTTPENYACGEVIVNPDRVILTGPQTIIDSLRDVNTEPIVLDKRTIEGFECKAKIICPEMVHSQPYFTTVQVEIYKKLDQRIFRGIPVSVMNLSVPEKAVFKLIPTNIDVTVQGMKNVLETMSGEELKPFIDLSSCKGTGTFMAEPQCFISLSGISVIKVYPTEFIVEIK